MSGGNSFISCKMTSYAVLHLSGENVCNHDENTVTLMRIWLRYRPASLLEFYIRVYEHFDKDINVSFRNFVKTYNLYE